MIRAALALAGALAAASDVAADEAFVAAALAAAPDVAYGEYLATECVTCHKLHGDAGNIPVVSGRPRDLFLMALAAYRDGGRAHQVMEMVARSMGPEEAASLAAYFETITP
jgi:cytochrome c